MRSLGISERIIDSLTQIYTPRFSIIPRHNYPTSQRTCVYVIGRIDFTNIVETPLKHHIVGYLRARFICSRCKVTRRGQNKNLFWWQEFIGWKHLESETDMFSICSIIHVKGYLKYICKYANDCSCPLSCT